jgi:type IV pilus assembly protein PilP
MRRLDRTRATSRARAALVAGLALLLAGCSEKTKPLARPTPPVAAQPRGATAKAEPEVQPAPPEWIYSSVGKRDPFRGFLAELEASGASPATKCRTPLGRFELSQLKLTAVVTGLADPVAMVEAPNGVGYTLRRGICIGRNGGTVAAVRSGEVVISEWAMKADGTRDRTQTILRLPKQPALDIEE